MVLLFGVLCTSSLLFYVLLLCMVAVLILFPRMFCIVLCFCACVRSLSFHTYYGVRDFNAYVINSSLGALVCCVFVDGNVC